MSNYKVESTFGSYPIKVQIDLSLQEMPSTEEHATIADAIEQLRTVVANHLKKEKND